MSDVGRFLTGKSPANIAPGSYPFTVLTVDPDNPAADYTTVSDAVDNAAAGDIIAIGPGTYNENNINVTVAGLIFQGSGRGTTTLRLSSAINADLIDANNFDITLRDLTLEVDATGAVTDLNGLLVPGATLLERVGIIVDGALQSGTDDVRGVFGANTLIMRDCVLDVASAGGVAVLGDSGLTTTILENVKEEGGNGRSLVTGANTALELRNSKLGTLDDTAGASSITLVGLNVISSIVGGTSIPRMTGAGVLTDVTSAPQLSILEAQISDLTHTDADAIHDNVAGEIAAITEKASPVSADLLLIEDSAAGNVKKRVQVANLPAGAPADNSITNAKLADMAANTIKANATGASADPADLTVGTNTVVGRVAGNIVAALLATAQIAANAITNAKLATMAQATFKGRASGAGTGDPVDLTATQATAILNNFTSTLKGLVPGSGGGTANFLRADGTWAAPTAAPPAATMTEATGDITTTSATDVQVTSMSVTPASGTYLVTFTSDVRHSSNNQNIFVSIYSAGSQVAASEREFDRGAGQGDVRCSVACQAKVTVNGSQAIAAYWRTGSSTATMGNRQLSIVRVT